MGMDHYRRLKELGGVSGAILAEDKQDPSKRVVIKRVADGAQGMEELNASLRVRHPNIVKFVESFISDGSLFVVLQYEPGGDLDSLFSRLLRLKKMPTSLTQLTWFVQMLDALAYCHESGYIHRDIKPSNIFLSEDTKVLYLGDFGSAKALSAGDVTTTFVGSPMWISPEVLLGTPYTYSSDVWSMGCVFYEMTCLRRPFGAPNFARLVQQITSGRVAPLPESVEEPIRGLILSMLLSAPEERPSAAELLMRAQRALADERRRADFARRAPPPARRDLPRAPTPADRPVEVATPTRTPPPSPQQQRTPPPHQRQQQQQRPAPQTPDQLTGSMYGAAAADPPAAAAARDASPPPAHTPTISPTTSPKTPALVAEAAAAPPVAAAAAPAEPAAAAEMEAEMEAADNSYHNNDDDDGGGGGGGKAVAMFVAITPRAPRKKKGGGAKKARPAKPAGAPLAQRSATPSPVPSKGSPTPSAAVGRTPPGQPVDVRTFSPKQVGREAGRRQVAARPALSFRRMKSAATPADSMEASLHSHPRSSAPTLRASVAQRAANPPPPPPVPRRAMAAAADHQRRPDKRPAAPVRSPQRAAAHVVKRRPSAAAQPLVSMDSWDSTPVEEMRKSQWLRARRDDVSAIEDYLSKFRANDAEVLHPYEESATSRRRPSLVSFTGGGHRSASRPARGGCGRSRSPEAMPPAPPPLAPPPPQQLQRGVAKSSSGGGVAPAPKKTVVMARRRVLGSPERFGVTHSSTSILNSTNGSSGQRGGRQASNAHASQPRTQEEMAQLEEDRRVARAKREAEREKMADMIRQRRMQQKKQKKKRSAGQFDVDILVPDK